MREKKTDVQLRRTHAGCWCGSIEELLVGKNIVVTSVRGLRVPDEVATITGVRHVYPPDQCELRINGDWFWPVMPDDGPNGDTATVQVTTAQAGIWARIEAVAHEGEMSLSEAMAAIGAVADAYRQAGDLIPSLARGAPAIRRAFRPRRPDLPPAASSHYTRARIRELPSGRWAADLGFGSSLRTLGEFDSFHAAQAAIHQAACAAWKRLEMFLRTYIVGEWSLTQRPWVGVEVVFLDGE